MNFEIVIDYSDVEHVYDYGQQKWIQRPETGYQHEDMVNIVNMEQNINICSEI